MKRGDYNAYVGGGVVGVREVEGGKESNTAGTILRAGGPP